MRKRIKRSVGPLEMKFANFNTSTAQQYGSGAGLSSDITAVTQAVGVNSRIGDQIDLIALEGRVTLFQQTTNPQSITRNIVFVWIPDSIPTISSVLDNGVTGSPDYTSMYNYDARHQYVILLDRTTVMVGGASASNNTVQYDYRVNLRGRRANFSAAATTGDNHVWIWFLGQNAAGANGQLVSATHRLFYVDP